MKLDANAKGVYVIAPTPFDPDGRVDDASVDRMTDFFVQAGADGMTVQMTPALIRRIVTENPACMVLKHEDWPGLEKISTLRTWEKEGSMRRISILAGNNALFLDFEMERGADGANTGYCFPDMLVDVVRLSRSGQRDAAHDLFDAHLPLIRYEQQPGPGLAVRKYVMMRRGIIASDAIRKPGGLLTAVAREEVDYLLSRLALKDSRARI